jgi:hypothetical protein
VKCCGASLPPLALDKQLDNVLPMRIEKPGKFGSSRNTSQKMPKAHESQDTLLVQNEEGRRNALFILGID